MRSASTPDAQLQSEATRREKLFQPFLQASREAENAASRGDLEKACGDLAKAYQALSEPFQQTAQGKKARGLLSSWEAELGNLAAKKQNWPEARNRALAALQWNQENESARDLLERSDQILRRGKVEGEDVNPALTSSFFERLQSVEQALKQGNEYRETGQLDRAEKAYEEALAVDPFNRVATEGIRKIYAERALVASQSRDLANLEARRQVREAWNNIYPSKQGDTGGTKVSGPMTASPSFYLEQKLKNTFLPEVVFSGADLETIRRVLKTLSQQYDPDAKKNGVNFLVSAEIGEAQPVYLKLRDVSLAEVVRYVAQIAGVKARFTDLGVIFSPVVEKVADLTSRTYRVSPSFFRTDASESASSATPWGGDTDTKGEGEAQAQSAKEKLIQLGVPADWPEGASAIYSAPKSELQVIHRPEILDYIAQLINAAEEQTLLIQVGVRLVEINQTDLDSVTVNSTLGGSGANLLNVIPAAFDANNSTGVTPAPSAQQGVTAQLNQIQGVGLLPNNTLQSFLQPTVLAGTNQTTTYALNTFQMGGTILNGMQFRTLITALSQKSSANVLANPSIVLKRGQRGKIEVTQEFLYVKEYNEPQSSIRTIIPAGGGVFNTGVPGPETVIGSFPSQISDPVSIGVTMGVEPDVTGDNTRVLMKLEPTFVDFEGFINYGTPINSSYAASYFDETVTILTNNIQQPVFVRRVVELPAVEVTDGHTLMLGGLLREDIQKIDEKVPIIGDIPLLGRAFQGKTEQAVKKNTLMFVTPRILRVDGQPLNPTAGSSPTATAALSP